MLLAWPNKNDAAGEFEADVVLLLNTLLPPPAEALGAAVLELELRKLNVGFVAPGSESGNNYVT